MHSGVKTAQQAQCVLKKVRLPQAEGSALHSTAPLATCAMQNCLPHCIRLPAATAGGSAAGRRSACRAGKTYCCSPCCSWACCAPPSAVTSTSRGASASSGCCSTEGQGRMAGMSRWTAAPLSQQLTCTAANLYQSARSQACMHNQTQRSHSATTAQLSCLACMSRASL